MVRYRFTVTPHDGFTFTVEILGARDYDHASTILRKYFPVGKIQNEPILKTPIPNVEIRA